MDTEEQPRFLRAWSKENDIPVREIEGLAPLSLLGAGFIRAHGRWGKVAQGAGSGRETDSDPRAAGMPLTAFSRRKNPHDW